ncbi:MAG: hypothetical protein IJU40_05885, partial [Desulfovibrionaceae bacterium]|nr:hypothetical protein [Desulfovibrionaceae bacterium]
PKLHFIGTYSVKQTSQSALKPRKEYFFVFRCEIDGNTVYVLQELNDAYIPTGNVNTADASILKEYFEHEPHILAMPLYKPQIPPEKLKAPRHVPSPLGDKPKAPTFTTPDAKVLAKAREEALRSNFEEACKNLSQPTERNKALRAIKKIATQEEGIVPEHKHMFRDFSVSLRKKSLPEVALLFATRNLKLSPNDDHAHFNVARIYAVMERFDDAIKELNTAMSMEVEEEDKAIYRRMLAYIEQEKRKRIAPDLRHQG